MDFRESPLSLSIRFRAPIVGSLVVLTVSLVLTACSSGGSPSPAPAATAAPAPATLAPEPTATPAPTETPRPEATATPAFIPGPTAAPIRRVSSILDTSIQRLDESGTGFVGTIIRFEIDGFEEFERLTLTFVRPDGGEIGPFFLRADRSGFAEWTRDTTGDPVGDWKIAFSSDLDRQGLIQYSLRDFSLPPASLQTNGPTFHVYHTPEVRVHFYPEIPTASVALVASHAREALTVILEDLGTTLDEVIDFYLVPDGATMIQEVAVGSAESISGFEAGVSLHGFERDGIYLDMSTSIDAVPHLVAHELVHQVAARIGAQDRPPVWFVEGLAEFEANKAAVGDTSQTEVRWRMERRRVVRDAVEEGRLLDLGPIREIADLAMPDSEAELNVLYSQAFATVDLVGRTYGTLALKTLAQRLADQPTELDQVFQDLFALSFGEFQAQLEESIVTLEALELERDALARYAATMEVLVNEARAGSAAWNGFAAGRGNLSREERLATLNRLLAENRNLEARASAVAVPDVAGEAHRVFLDGFRAFSEALEEFRRLETVRSGGDAQQANNLLRRANTLIAVGNETLTLEINRLGVQAGQRTPR